MGKMTISQLLQLLTWQMGGETTIKKNLFDFSLAQGNLKTNMQEKEEVMPIQGSLQYITNDLTSRVQNWVHQYMVHVTQMWALFLRGQFITSHYQLYAAGKEGGYAYSLAH